MAVFRVYDGASPSALQALNPYDGAVFSPEFTFTAATSDAAHSSGWRVMIHLDREGRSETGEGSRWRSGEVLRGTVELEPVDRLEDGAPPRKRVTSVVVRAYHQSTTLFQAHKIILQEPSGVLSKLQPAAVGVKTVSEGRAEWHRGFCINGGEGTELWEGGTLEEISREVEGDFPLLEGEHAGARAPPPRDDRDTGATLPFVFGLPTTTQITASNFLSNPPPIRRILQTFLRTPPASLPSSACRNGTVEWIVEALVRVSDSTEPEEPSLPEALPEFGETPPPAFSPATPQPMLNTPSQFGFIESTPSLIATRVVFPFEPTDHHQQDLYSSWRPDVTGTWAAVVAEHNGLMIREIVDTRPITTGIVPGFGKDPRDEALGGSHVGPARALKGLLVDAEGGRDKWTCFEKRIPMRNVFGRLNGWMRCEIATPAPAVISRHAATLPFLLHVSYPTPPALSPKATAKLKPMYLDKLVVMLSTRILTCGGRDARPKFSIEEIRRVEIKLWDDGGDDSLQPVKSASAVEDGRTHLRLQPGGSGSDIKVEFDLQTPGRRPNGKPMKALKDAGVSFRTPNIEVEYIISATLQPIGQPCFFCLRCPIQVLAGDLDELTPFAAATGTPALHLPFLSAPAVDDGLPDYHEG